MDKMQFIEKSQKAHNQKYDYSYVVYNGRKTKVKLICPNHGEFFQTPDNHMYGKGCKKCFDERRCLIQRSEFSHFIKKSQSLHGNLYDYSKAKYVNSKTKLTIICPKHGEFFQIPCNHYKYGCSKCSCEKAHDKQRKNLESFIEAANIKHNTTYDYSKTEYRQAHRKIEIICSKHGSFLQTPNSHLFGRGCPECKKGEGHPRYGKSSLSCFGYYGQYKNNTFRSLSELFWMLEAEKQQLAFIGLDQSGNRTKWQVSVNHTGRPGTYCADFYIHSTNEIIDIKPIWKISIEAEKLKQGQEEYEKRGYIFKIVDTKSIKINIATFKKLVLERKVELYPSAINRFEKRFGKIHYL